jgi:integrase
MGKRQRGTGSLFLAPGSSVWWTAVWYGGVRLRESTGTRSRRRALAILKERAARAMLGQPQPSRASVAGLVLAKLRRERNQGLASAADNQARWEHHLRPGLGHLPASAVRPADLEAYSEARKAEGTGNAAINRELALLRGAYHLARRTDHSIVVPWFPMLPEPQPVKQFLADDKYEALAAECSRIGPWLRCCFEIGYRFGWRRGELLGMRVSQADLAARTIRLLKTKNRRGRVIPMGDNLLRLVKGCCEEKAPEGFLFTWPDGRPVKDFRGAWAKATEAAGVPGLRFHSLRRTAARNLRRAGYSEHLSMEVTGHRTADVFRRYDITDLSDLEEVADGMDMDALRLSQGSAKVEAEKPSNSP